MTLRTSLALLFFFVTPLWSAETPSRPAVDAVFALYDRPDSPGCSLGIMEQGELSYSRGYGMANLEHGVPIGPDTVFRIASTSKQIRSKGRIGFLLARR